MKKLIGKLLCKIGIHDYIIEKWSSYKDRKLKYLFEEGFYRTCERCDKRQILLRPTKYHPTKYVWSDLGRVVEINENN